MNSYVIRQEISSQLPVVSSELESLLTGSKLTFQNQLCVAFAGSKEFLPSSKTSNSVFFGKRVSVPDGRETDNVSASKTCGHEGLRSSLYLRVRKCELATLSRSGSQR